MSDTFQPHCPVCGAQDALRTLETTLECTSCKKELSLHPSGLSQDLHETLIALELGARFQTKTHTIDTTQAKQFAAVLRQMCSLSQLTELDDLIRSTQERAA